MLFYISGKDIYMKNKKTMIAIISVIAVILVLIGVTYAYWLITEKQEGENVISSACLNISLNGENDIELTDQYPINDNDGMKLTPYTFTVTNNCTTSIGYRVNLESIGESSSAIKASAIKVAIGDNIKLLSNIDNASITENGAYAANMIAYGILAGKSDETTEDEVTYNLRLWLDKDAPISEQNKTFRSKITVTIGQELFNTFEEGTLAYEILSNSGGEDPFINLSTDWVEADPSTVSASSSYVGTSSYWYGTTYDFDTKTGKYKLAGTLVQATLTECRNGTKTCGNYTFKNADQSYEGKSIYYVTSFGTSGNNATLKTLSSYNNFSSNTPINNSGIFNAKDDLGTSYYFKGTVTDNYVKFGVEEKVAEWVYRIYYEYQDPNTENYVSRESTVSYTTYDECANSTEMQELEASYGDYEMYYASCNEYSNSDSTIINTYPIYWRIVRINGDGTIRLVYAGNNPEVIKNPKIGDSEFNPGYQEKSNGYTIADSSGNHTDSTIKAVVDKWYTDILEKDYGKYIADSIFCNDKEIYKAKYYDANWAVTNNAAEAIAADNYYGAYGRLYDNKAPKLTCTRKEDRYTMDETIGNGLLTKPIGLLSADEVMFAGGSTGYLSSTEAFWTSTPSWFNGNTYNDALYIYTGPTINDSNMLNGNPTYGVRPVINLKKDVKFTGDGRIDTNTPYEIVME